VEQATVGMFFFLALTQAKSTRDYTTLLARHIINLVFIFYFVITDNTASYTIG